MSPTSSSTKNGSYMNTVDDIGMDVTKEKSEVLSDENSFELPVTDQHHRAEGQDEACHS